MSPPSIDVLVLGAGIVGVSTALFLQKAGLSVVLADNRDNAGLGTSYGNAGLIERSSVMPRAFPRQIKELLRFASNRAPEVHYHIGHLIKSTPYWWHSEPKRHLKIAYEVLPLLKRCVETHLELADAAGARHFIREEGWIKVFRKGNSFETAEREYTALADFNLKADVLAGTALRTLEPALTEQAIGGIHWRDPVTVSNPSKLVQAYADLFKARGGVFVHAQAEKLAQQGQTWVLPHAHGMIKAEQTVVALGPWSDVVYRPLGYRFPLQVKRGYHRHYAQPLVPLRRPVLDHDGGFLLAPMEAGIRLTTGVEFADREAPATPVQITRCEPIARSMVAMGEGVETAPWLGGRPSLPDMKPILGRAPRHETLWLAFGHNHHGLTLGPISGRFMAELITTGTPFTDPAPYRAERF
jgi:D-amino-acid dehydrogenase